MTTPVEHHLKIAPKYFEAQMRGNKNFEKGNKLKNNVVLELTEAPDGRK